ncbi:MAG: ATP-binding protein [Pseudomonadales bacterium]
MLQNSVILIAAFSYLGILFAIAYFADKRADQQRSIISNPYVYTLSIAVYCTAWTFFGSVGRAASTGVGFLPIYLGPTLMAVVWWFVLRKIIRIAKTQRITSIADFIGSRYGKSALLTGLVTIIAVVGILPYISLQLKAVSTSYFIVQHYPELVMPGQPGELAIWEDTALYVALLLAAFTILFGTRQIDVTERHEGMVAAIAFESLFKLVAFLAVGVYVTFGVFSGPGDIYSQVSAAPHLSKLLTMEALPGGYAAWFSLTVISMFAIMFLPRQFQVTVVENVDEAHIRKASWLFPLYLLVINIFVLPLAFGGLLLFPGSVVDPDTFVLTIPMAQRQEALALLVFLGGLSAATGMVIVATIALSTMVSNELVMPALLRSKFLRLTEQQDLTWLVLGIRRGAIVVILLLAYLYFRLIGESYALVTIGLVSFAAAAQFAPAILLGIYWTDATRRGALVGLTTGFVIWAYTLLLPAFAKSGWLPASFVEQGLFGWSVLKPYALFGLEGLDPITHAVFWSLPANALLLVAVSLFSRPGALEALQARAFVNVFEGDQRKTDVWRGTVLIAELQALVARFIGEEAAQRSFATYARQQGINFDQLKVAEPHTHLVSYTERLLAGVIGAASARVMVSTLFKGQTLNIEDVMDILDETSQVMEYSHRLEHKTEELEAVGKELRSANERLQELDRLKDDFVSTVSHELRTPLTSIRAFSEILLSEPDLDLEQRQNFLQIVVNETERLTRLTNDVLDLAKIESGRMDWNMQQADMCQVIEDAISSVFQLYQERCIELHKDLPDEAAGVNIDRDRILQVIINLLSNAAKFCERDRGQVRISLTHEADELRVCVADNGPGIELQHHATLFDKFQQVSDQQQGKPKGSGLGLAICKLIVEHHGGRIWLESEPGQGSRFFFTLRLA